MGDADFVVASLDKILGRPQPVGQRDDFCYETSLPQFSESPVLCMQADPGPFFSNKLIAMGHRNGTVSIWDSGSNQINMSTSCSSRNLSTTFGSTTSIVWLSNGYQLLARGSMGNCHLYDVRRMGRTSKNNTGSSRKNCSDPALLWELKMPPTYHNIRSKMALYCNGITVDPAESVAIAPLLTPKSEEPGFGFWSLMTGRWIGQKQLVPDDQTPANEKPPPYLELCQRTTSACTRKSSSENEFIIKDVRKRNKFGIWFKCGREVVPKNSSTVPGRAVKFGSIYHMALSADGE